MNNIDQARKYSQAFTSIQHQGDLIKLLEHVIFHVQQSCAQKCELYAAYARVNGQPREASGALAAGALIRDMSANG